MRIRRHRRLGSCPVVRSLPLGTFRRTSAAKKKKNHSVEVCFFDMGTAESKWDTADGIQKIGLCCEQERKNQRIFRNRKSLSGDQASISTSLGLQKDIKQSTSIDDLTAHHTSTNESIENVNLESRSKFSKNRNFACSFDSLVIENELRGWKNEECEALEASIITASQKMYIKPPGYLDNQVLQYSW